MRADCFWMPFKKSVRWNAPPHYVSVDVPANATLQDILDDAVDAGASPPSGGKGVFQVQTDRGVYGRPDGSPSATRPYGRPLEKGVRFITWEELDKAGEKGVTDAFAGGYGIPVAGYNLSISKRKMQNLMLNSYSTPPEVFAASVINGNTPQPYTIKKIHKRGPVCAHGGGCKTCSRFHKLSTHNRHLHLLQEALAAAKAPQELTRFLVWEYDKETGAVNPQEMVHYVHGKLPRLSSGELRPLRIVKSSSSTTQLAGSRGHPGEVALANRGILYLHNLSDFGTEKIRLIINIVKKGTDLSGAAARPKLVIGLLTWCPCNKKEHGCELHTREQLDEWLARPLRAGFIEATYKDGLGWRQS